MIPEEEEEIELDIYYQGTKSDLYSFIYPLTGPSSVIFDKLELERTKLDSNNHEFQWQYKPMCNNLDKIDPKQASIFYKGNSIPSRENYFYSTYQPDNQAIIWSNIKNFVEVRPDNDVDKGKK